MNLSRKTMLYSSIISVIIVSLIVGYFILMLPSLYVDFMREQNYDFTVKLQKEFMKTGSYENLEVKNPTATMTVKIPMTGNTIYVVSKYFQVTMNVENDKIQDLLEQIRYYAKHPDELEEMNIEEFDFTEIKNDILSNSVQTDNDFLQFELEVFDNENVFQEAATKVHIEADNLIIFEANVSDGQNYYTNYIAIGKTEDTIIITMVPVMTPTMDEIRPVVFQSVPMILAVALLLVLVSSQAFSKLIINPIIKLANHAVYMKDAKNLKLEPIAISGRDEISSLGESLNGLYKKIQESYHELEVKNRYLAEENKRQEVFLRASSHQLKTPITAALLLVHGMINEVGKYKDVKLYLPQVKEQILSMQRIVEDILYLNHCSINLQMDRFSLQELMDECLSSYEVQIEENSLNITKEGQGWVLMTDREVLKKILYNLLSNAVKFTPEGGRIHIAYEEHRLLIINYGAHIEKELLPHVFEPFVTSTNITNTYEMKPRSVSNDIKGHGLGLYVVAYYEKLLNCHINLQNIDQGVMAELLFG